MHSVSLIGLPKSGVHLDLVIVLNHNINIWLDYIYWVNMLMHMHVSLPCRLFKGHEIPVNGLRGVVSTCLALYIISDTSSSSLLSFLPVSPIAQLWVKKWLFLCTIILKLFGDYGTVWTYADGAWSLCCTSIFLII